MKTYQIDGKPNDLWFTNYDRVEEEVLFQSVMDKLNLNPDIHVEKKQTGPSEDFYQCSISGLPFILLYDLDYGVSIKSESQLAIRKLKEYFE